MKWTGARFQIQDLALAALMMAVMLGVGLFAALQVSIGDGRMPQGASINGIDVSGMDAVEAELVIIEAAEREMLGSFSLTVQVGGIARVYFAEDLQVTTNASAIFRERFAPLFENGMIGKADALFELKRGVELDFSLQYSTPAIDQAAFAYAAALYREPKNAVLTIDPVTHEFVYTQEIPGYMVDARELSQRIQERFKASDFSSVQMELSVVDATVTVDSLRENIFLLSKFELPLTGVAKQDEVIQRFVEALNGSIMESDQNFSLKEVFASKGISLPREEEPSSRVGTAFYIAALLADAVKVERTQNSALLDYVEEGYGASFNIENDLVMRCESSVPFYVVASMKNDSFVIEIYGKRERNMPEIRLRSAVDSLVLPEEKPEEPLFIADDTKSSEYRELLTPARGSCRVSLYREYYEGSTILKSELLSLDRYASSPAVYKVGTR